MMRVSFPFCTLFFGRVAVQAADPLNLLMVGNSFSEAHNMEEMLQAMLEERKMMLQTDSIFAARFEVGGANMTRYAHAPDLTTMVGSMEWTWIVLQEQSQIPGFCADDPSEYLEAYNNSLQSVLSLNDQIQNNGATTILFETWGYFETDPYNPSRFPDYQTMQDKLTKGYQIYYDSILQKNPSAKVKIAPAGLAVDRIYQSSGMNPLQEGSLFEQLYMRVEDHPTPNNNKARKYPTLAGAYLCGCVLFQTLTGLDVRQSTYTPDGLDPKMKSELQRVAYETVVAFQGETPMEDSTTKPPYNPIYEPEEVGGGSWWSWSRYILAGVLMAGGLACYWMGANKNQAVPRARDYGWNPVSADDNAMELSPVTQNPDIQRV